MNKKERLEFERMKAQAISSQEQVIKELNDFLDNEGHSNKQVVIALTHQVLIYEDELEQLKSISVESSLEDLVWHQHWKNICEIRPGQVDMQQVKKELADYHMLLNEVPKVYEELTGFSKPFTRAEVILGSVNKNYILKDFALSDLKDAAEDGKVDINYIEEYFKN